MMTTDRSVSLRPTAGRGAAARILTALVMALAVGGFLRPAPVAAHAELTSSDPANASTVTEPVEVVTLTFSKPSEPVPDRFAIGGPEGEVAVDSVEADEDGLVVTVRPDEPLTDGRYRISWGIRAGDTHTMDGAITVTVDAGSPAPTSGAATPPGPASAAATTDTMPSTPEAQAVDADPLAERDVPTSTPAAERVATLLRWALYLGLLGAVGGTAYLATVHRGPRPETRWLVFLVRRAAAAVVLVSLVAVPVQAAVLGGGWGGVMSPGAWADALGSGFGTATLLRLGGAVLVLAFLGASLVPARDGRGARRLVDVDLSCGDRAPGAAPATGGTATAVLGAPVVRRSRRGPVRIAPAPLAWLGAILLVASESFLGHTADTAPRAVMVLDDALHLGAAGVWFAGVGLLAATARRRRGERVAPSLAPLAARFSTLAAWSLVAVAVTGVVMGALILGEVGAVWSSTFGRVLLLKVVLVGALGGLGAYHRRAVLPGLDLPDGPDPDALTRFRTTLGLEVVLFVAVIGLTAVLVGASPVP